MLLTSSQSTLIIIPGWGGSQETWANFVDQAKQSFHDVQVIELPCFGKEPCPTDVWGVEEYAEFVRQKLTTLPSSQILLLGHSFGGVIATHLAANHPEIIKKLIIVGAPIFRQKRGLRWYFFLITAKIGKIIFQLPVLHRCASFAKRVLYKVADSPDYNQTDGIKRAIFQKITRQDVHELLPTIHIPTLVLWGTHDSYVPVHDATRISKLLPAGKLITIEQGKHGLHHSHPAELLTKLVEFSSNSSV